MSFSVLNTINTTGRLNSSQNFAVARPTVLNTIFPDVKIQHFKAKYYRLIQGQNLLAPVFMHALDSEVHIGTRPTFEKVPTKKLLIKEKINQSEQLQMYINSGAPDNDGLVGWVFDDMGRLSESVVTRTKIAKGQAMNRGAMKIRENNLDVLIGFGVSTAHKITFGDWPNLEYDTFGDTMKAVKMLKGEGRIPPRTLTSDTQIQHMGKNKDIQSVIHGNINAGRLVTMNELRSIITEEFGLQIATCDERYAYIKADGPRVNGRYFGEDKVTFYTADVSGRAGTGLWGPTSKEAEYAVFQEALQKIFVTVTMWATEDPVVKWTKASGMFIPILLDVYSMVIATVTTAENIIGTLTAGSSAGSASGATKLTVPPAKIGGNSYKYKIGDPEIAVSFGQNIQIWTAWDGSVDITAQAGKTITVVECDSAYKALKAGSATVTAKAG